MNKKNEYIKNSLLCLFNTSFFLVFFSFTAFIKLCVAREEGISGTDGGMYEGDREEGGKYIKNYRFSCVTLLFNLASLPYAVAKILFAEERENINKISKKMDVRKRERWFYKFD